MHELNDRATNAPLVKTAWSAIGREEEKEHKRKNSYKLRKKKSSLDLSRQTKKEK